VFAAIGTISKTLFKKIWPLQSNFISRNIHIFSLQRHHFIFVFSIQSEPLGCQSLEDQRDQPDQRDQRDQPEILNLLARRVDMENGKAALSPPTNTKQETLQIGRKAIVPNVS